MNMSKQLTAMQHQLSAGQKDSMFKCGSAAVVAAFLVVTAAGCGSTEDPRGVRVPVDGYVTLDGDMLPMGRIVFVADGGKGEVKATAMITDGAFRFTTENGPFEGDARVEIYPVEMELEEFESARNGDTTRKVDFTKVHIPDRYNKNSKLTATVTSDGDQNLYSFDLTSD